MKLLITLIPLIPDLIDLLLLLRQQLVLGSFQVGEVSPAFGEEFRAVFEVITLTFYVFPGILHKNEVGIMRLPRLQLLQIRVLRIFNQIDFPI